ncbi:MAG: NAD-dependent epimerase/dehydratase family protein [candidate division WS1 bacterium]|jgi:nucleoside-diphosphate-sugar epimerase|nr:NAD-dependent epimerase/dehydratase family protein [candidate division WS1 bacterium]
MRVLLIGGTGCISSEVAALAAKRSNIELYLLNRGRRPKFIPEGAYSLQGDISRPEEIRELTAGMEFEVVADFLSYSLEQMEQTLNLFQERCGQFIFISSAAVYWPRHFNEIITEENTPAGNTLWSYARNKILCEQRLAEEREKNGLDYTVVRPAFTYNNLRIFHPVGPPHQEYSWTIAHRILQGKPLLMQDDGTALCTVTYAADFAKAFVGLMGNPGAYGEAFHITSDEWLTYNRAAEMLGEALGVPTRLCHIPAHILGLELGGDFGEKLISFARGAAVDSRKVRKLVPEFVCTTSFAQGLRKCIQFYEENPEFKVVHQEWEETMDRLAEKHGEAYPL